MQYDKITLVGSHQHGYNVTGWQDGCTVARIIWRDTESVERYQRDVTSEREVLGMLSAIALYVNLVLVSAELITS